MSRQKAALSCLLLAVVMIPSAVPRFTHQAYGTTSSTPSFTFAAGGDIGTPTQGAAAVSLSYLASTNPDFFLALGDLSYVSAVTGNMWCNEFKELYGNVEIIDGAHDTGENLPTDTSATRSYEKFVAGCPFTLGSPTCENVPGQCTYGKEYYFDYPSPNPLARFILISPAVFNITGACSTPCSIPHAGQVCNIASETTYNCWPYAKNDTHYNWVNGTIYDARIRGIKWVIVGMHKPCISAGKENCDIGPDLFNLLLSPDADHRVDLILEATDHAYERSKQLSLGQNACQTVPYSNTTTFVDYDPNCVVDDGSNRFYLPHAGTILIIQGTMGGGWNDVDDAEINPNNAAEAPYFATGELMGNNTVGTGHGFVKYTVSANEIDVETVFTGTFQDKFRIAYPPVPSFSWAPHNLSIGETVTLNSNVTGSIGPLSYSWDFGDGAIGTGPVVEHAFSQSRQYAVTLTVTDSSGVGTVEGTVTVGSWNRVVECSSVQTTIEEIIGPKGVNRTSSDSSSIGADYTGGGFQLVPNLQYNPQSPANPTNWPFYKRAVNIPPDCSYGGRPAFVELHNVGVRTVSVGSCDNYYDVSNGEASYPNGWQSCITAFNLENWNYTTCPACYMHRIYAYIDRDWNASGDAPYPAPIRGEKIDIQGFVYWEFSSVTADWHSYSGWELLVTAWRVSQQNQTQPPNPPSAQGPRIPASVIYVGLGALFAGVFALGIFYERKRGRSKYQREETHPSVESRNSDA